MSSNLRVRQRFEGRITLFNAAVILMMLALLGRMVYLQWIEHDRYTVQAERNRIDVVPILPTRGEILDREGRGMAVNRVSFIVQMTPKNVPDVEATLAELTAMIGWSPEQMAQIRKRIKATRPDHPVLLDNMLTWEKVAPLTSRLHRMTGIDVKAGTHRYYPYGEQTAHLIGYLSLAGQKDIDAGYLPMDFVGRSGLEMTFEKVLHGTPGYEKEEVNAHGQKVSVVDTIPPIMGQSLRLTIDARVQQAAATALGEKTGAAVVLDVQTGGVVALVSQPGFDTNQFIAGLEPGQWKMWVEDAKKPLLNRSVMSAYPPASTFKILTSLAGLRQQAPLAKQKVNCPGYLNIGSKTLRCWEHKGHGQVDIHDAIVRSCDVYFYQLGDQLGMEHLSAEAALWGLGSRTGIDIGTEARGNIPINPETNSKPRKFYRGEVMITAIGQGALTVTPVQMARFAAAIANGGKMLKPQFVFGAPPQVVRTIDVQPQDLYSVRLGMRDVVADPHGTVYWVLNNAKWPIAGKTGTAQVVSMPKGATGKEAVAEQFRDHAWFIGFAPFDKPKIAFAIFVEHGGHGGSAAGPVAKAIVEELAIRESSDPYAGPLTTVEAELPQPPATVSETPATKSSATPSAQPVGKVKTMAGANVSGTRATPHVDSYGSTSAGNAALGGNSQTPTPQRANP